MFLSSSHCHNNKLITEELENTFEISSFPIEDILKVHREITIQHFIKTPCITGISQNEISFGNYLLCYTAKISLKIEYIKNNSLLLLPFELFYSSYISLKDNHETVNLNPKINNFIIKKVDEENLYVYISFFPY